jgi:hypothetical protein
MGNCRVISGSEGSSIIFFHVHAMFASSVLFLPEGSSFKDRASGVIAVEDIQGILTGYRIGWFGIIRKRDVEAPVRLAAAHKMVTNSLSGPGGL